jgi:hypothetical protein
MTRFARWLPVGALVAVPALAGQASAGAELWRVAGVTLPIPPALATGGAAAFWNPAQDTTRGPSQVGVELVQTPQSVGAFGVLATGRVWLRPIGVVGVTFGRMSIGDLVRTSYSPDPDGGDIPFFTQSVGLSWARSQGGTTLGAGVAYRHTHLDNESDGHWTFDVGVQQRVGDRLRLAAATHGLSRVGTDPSQNVFAGAEYVVWRGRLWGNLPGALRGRYGVAFARGSGAGADHQFGAGLDVSTPLSIDVMVTREGGYTSDASWRAVAGFRLSVGHYRLAFARDGGVSDIGSAYRVGLEASLR